MADESSNSETGFISSIISELFGSPLNIGLLSICVFLLYKIIKGKGSSDPPPKKPELPKMKKRDFTLEQLREFDGKGPEGRILIAVNGKVFDVTRGKRFYGPGMLFFCNVFVSSVYRMQVKCDSFNHVIIMHTYCSLFRAAFDNIFQNYTKELLKFIPAQLQCCLSVRIIGVSSSYFVCPSLIM